jgi:hypothetical protein
MMTTRGPGSLRMTVRVQVGVAVDDQQGHPGQAVERRVQRRELAQVELARLVGLDVGYQLNPVGYEAGEGGIGGYDGRCPGAAGRQVVHVRSDEQVPVLACHAPRMARQAGGIGNPINLILSMVTCLARSACISE